jgi:hypothetical protein
MDTIHNPVRSYNWTLSLIKTDLLKLNSDRMDIPRDAAGVALCQDFIGMLRVILSPPTDRPSPNRVLNWENRDRISLWTLLCGAENEEALKNRCVVLALGN